MKHEDKHTIQKEDKEKNWPVKNSQLLKETTSRSYQKNKRDDNIGNMDNVEHTADKKNTNTLSPYQTTSQIFPAICQII